jgi:hypothetical protein
VVLCLVTAVHVVHISVDLINMLSKGNSVVSSQQAVLVPSLRQDRALLDFLAVKVVNVLGYEH